MGYIINSQGQKIKVDSYNGYCAENVVLIDNDTILVDKYIINVWKKNLYEDDSNTDLVAEIVVDNEPTDEEIIFYMAQNDVNRYSGYATIEKIKTLDFKDED